jgi:hypothetical protein
MASQMVSVRFPNGESEFRITAETPKVGDTLMRGEDEWRVSDIGADENGRAIVILGPLDGGTVVTLAPLAGGTMELGAGGAGIPREPPHV